MSFSSEQANQFSYPDPMEKANKVDQQEEAKKHELARKWGNGLTK